MPQVEPQSVAMRACGACRVRCEQSRLVRFTVRDGRVVPDVARRLGGRGLNLGPAPRCLERAVLRQVFSRGLKAPLPEGGVETLRGQIVADANDWLRETLHGALLRGGATQVDTAADIAPEALKRAMTETGDHDGPALSGVPWVRVTHPGLAARVAIVAATLSEFTFAIAGDSTRRPRPGEACEVLSGAQAARSTRQRDVHDRRRAVHVPTSSKCTGGGAG